jgi:DNA-binding protein Alba
MRKSRPSRRSTEGGKRRENRRTWRYERPNSHGRKPVWSYVLACLHALQQNGSVEVRARGRAIPKAIGAVQVLREGLMKGLEVESVDRDRAPSGEGRKGDPGQHDIDQALPSRE